LRQQGLRVERKLLAQDDRARMGEGKPDVRDSDADRLVAEVDAGQRPTVAQMTGQFLDAHSRHVISVLIGSGRFDSGVRRSILAATVNRGACS